MSIQEEKCNWSKSSGTSGIDCVDSATANVIDDLMVLSELITSAVEEKDFDEENQQVQNQLKLVKITKTEIAT